MGTNWFIALRVMPLARDAGGRVSDVVFGGWITSMVDVAAVTFGLVEKRFPRAVTAQINVDMNSPIKVGDVVTFYTTEKSHTTHSMTVEVSVEVFRPGTNSPIRCATGTAVIVPVDEAGVTLKVEEAAA